MSNKYEATEKHIAQVLDNSLENWWQKIGKKRSGSFLEYENELYEAYKAWKEKQMPEQTITPESVWKAACEFMRDAIADSMTRTGHDDLYEALLTYPIPPYLPSMAGLQIGVGLRLMKMVTEWQMENAS